MSAPLARLPAVAGLFYPSTPKELRESIRSSFLGRFGPGRMPELTSKEHYGPVECFVVPHAGYIYSGQIAAHGYFLASKILNSPTEELVVVVFGPNHYGIGSGVAVSPSSAWLTPLGELVVNRPLSKKILDSTKIIDNDALAHSREHSIEVQVPFIQETLASRTQVSFVPISLILQDLTTVKEVADSVYSAVQPVPSKRPVLILGSSDLTHYEPHEKAAKKDQKLLSAIESLDIAEFYRVLERENVTACGYGAIAAIILLAKMFGKKKGRVLKYATSGEISGDTSSVVGYSAVSFS